MKKICAACKNKMQVLCKLDDSEMHWSKCGICKKLFCGYCLCASEWSVLAKKPLCRAETRFKPAICHKCYMKHWWRK